MNKFIVFRKNYHEQSISFGGLKISLVSGEQVIAPCSYGFTVEGVAYIKDQFGHIYEIPSQHWFSTEGYPRGNYDFVGGYTSLVIEDMDNRFIHKPFAMGALPKTANLKYIDGAKNSLLYGPIRKGMPCLNMLHIDLPINQTPHTHPSPRIGVIRQGRVLVKIWDKEGEGAKVVEQYDLKIGHVWAMDKDVVHSFHTESSVPVQIFAFHPDSDFGPTDEVAPMINRTIVQGVSASDMPEIHTE